MKIEQDILILFFSKKKKILFWKKKLIMLNTVLKTEKPVCNLRIFVFLSTCDNSTDQTWAHLFLK